MANKKDYYDILEINKDADESTIKKAYRKLAKKYHPDTNTKNLHAEQRFKEITEAYTILSDPEKKKLYDRYGHMAFEGGFDPEAAKAGAYDNPGGAYREYHFEGGNMDDMFQDIFGSIFQEDSSGGYNYRGPVNKGRRSQKGTNLYSDVSITFDEAVFGCDKIIHLQSPDNPVGAAQSLKLHIPAGIETGKSIRLRQKGMPGYQGGEPGDLFLKVTVKEKPGFERKGMDIYTMASIPFTTAALGGEAIVRTLYGNVMCKIKEGTQSGTKIRLKGKGIVSMKNPDVHGDQYVTIQIQVPTALTPEARKSLKDFELACNQTDYKHRRGSAV